MRQINLSKYRLSVVFIIALSLSFFCTFAFAQDDPAGDPENEPDDEPEPEDTAPEPEIVELEDMTTSVRIIYPESKLGTTIKIDKFIEPPQLRPCCAFGHGLRTKIGESTVPVKIDNILNPDVLGRHSYAEKDISEEMNGLIYTCSAGVIDIAHVRDYVDWTAFLYVRIRKVLGTGALIRIPDEAAKREIILKSVYLDLSAQEKEELSILLAQRIAFELSVWHEIVTWYGYSTNELFSEELSSFSPEDIYSNLLGTHIGANALRRGGDFDEAVDVELYETIWDLVPLLPGHTKETLNMVDGIWWDRSRSLPDKRMVIRRNLDFGDDVKPWILSDRYSPYCSFRDIPEANYSVPSKGPGEVPLDSLYELRFYVDRRQVPDFHLPDMNRSWVNGDDYEYIISRIRREVQKEFGPFGDRSGMDLEELGVVPKYSRKFDPDFPCGRDDPACEKTMLEVAHGVKVGKLRAGGGNYPGPFVGGTLVEVGTSGGGFSLFNVNSAVNYDDGGYLLHIKALATQDALMFCSEEAEDGSGRSEIHWPFVNPFSSKCKGGSAFGIDVSLLEFVTDAKRNLTSQRPIEFGVVFNATSNGFSTDFLENHLLFSFGIAPELISRDDYDDAPVRFYGKMIWNSLYDNCRWGLRGFLQGRDDIGNYEDFMVEAGGRVLYNILWSHADLRNGESLHTMFTVILEGGVEYWSYPENVMPGMLKYYTPPDHRYNSPADSDDEFSAKVMLYLEMTIPNLGLF